METLARKGLANSHTVLKKGKIKFPSASSSDFTANLNFICELFQDNTITNCIAKKHEIVFERANFSNAKKVNERPKLFEIGVDQYNKPFCLNSTSGVIGIPAGGGKSIFLNGLIHSFYKNKKNTAFEIVIADSHSSFSKLKNIPNITLFALENSDEKQAFLKKIEEIKEYQKQIDLSIYETLSLAKENGAMLDKKEFLIILDEFSENFTSPSSRHPSFKINQEIIVNIEKIFTSGRKFSQNIFCAYQADTTSEAILNENYSACRVYGYMNGDTAKGKGLPTNHPILKEKGTFYFTSRNHPPCFFRTYPILKENLPALLKGGK